jgi:predicted nuclease of restriction endonuclease-like RecB superfamily
VDGPASLFKLTRKYGIQMALFLPSLLRITRWEMEAVLRKDDRELIYSLNSESPLRSYFAKTPAFDSLLEKTFAERWEKLQSPWVLEREVEIVDLKGTVFVPDFALRHGDGRTVHIEIVGFWHPDYLRRKMDKVRRANMHNLILAVSDRLNVSTEMVEKIPGPILFFKGKLEPKKVLEVLNTMDL